jgi:dolichol-phosphate mannosyltransferase
MIYILIPVFNEAQNIPNLKLELCSITLTDDIFFVFSDDGSTDNSKQLLQQEFSAYNYIILGDGVNRGPGAVFNKGFEFILQHSTNQNDVVVTMEADCTSDIVLLPKMIAINKLGFDVVLASVYAQGGGFDETNWFRKLISAIANLLFRLLFNVKVLTLSSFYRAYSIALLRKIKENNTHIIAETGFICMLEILLKSIKLNANIIEVPMVLQSHKRIGKSKMKVLKTTLTYIIFLLKK